MLATIISAETLKLQERVSFVYDVNGNKSRGVRVSGVVVQVKPTCFTVHLAHGVFKSYRYDKVIG